VTWNFVKGSKPGLSLSITGGLINDDRYGAGQRPTEKELNDFIRGISASWSFCALVCGGMTYTTDPHKREYDFGLGIGFALKPSLGPMGSAAQTIWLDDILPIHDWNRPVPEWKSEEQRQLENGVESDVTFDEPSVFRNWSETGAFVTLVDSYDDVGDEEGTMKPPDISNQEGTTVRNPGPPESPEP